MNALRCLAFAPAAPGLRGLTLLPLLTLLAITTSPALVGCGSSGPSATEPGGQADDQASEGDEVDDWDDVPETAGTQYNGSAIEALGISGPDTPWADMDEEAREFYMIGKVLPIMHKLSRHDAQRYEGFSCETCHGNNMREASFAMPVATIFRLPEPGSPGWSAMEATQGDAVRFMRDEVTPTMGTLLGMDDYTCFHCHTRR